LHYHHAHPINLAELLLLLAHQPICQHITPTVAVSGMHDIPENYILHKGKAKDKLELNWNHLRRFGGLTTSTFSKQGANCKTPTMLQNKQNQQSLVL
jgi:hypothetical protein